MFFALKKANIRTKPYKKEDKKVIYIGKIYKNAKKYRCRTNQLGSMT